MAVAVILLGCTARAEQLQWTQQCSDLQAWWDNAPASLFTVNNVLFYGWEHGLRRSTDNGMTWENLDAAVPGVFGDALKSWVLDDTFIYVVGAIPGSYQRSPDLGDTWEDTGFLLNNWYPGDKFIWLSPLGNVLYGIRQSSPVDSGGVWRSTDHGATWEPRNTFMYSGATVNAIWGMDGYLFATTNYRLYRSENEGLTWTGMNNAWQDPWDIRSFGHYGSRLLAAGEAPFGMRYSDDHGATFTPCTVDGFAPGDCRASFLEFGGSPYAVWGNGVKYLITSNNSGADWVNVDHPDWTHVHSAWSTGDTMYVLADRTNPNQDRCVFMTVVPNIGVPEPRAAETDWTVHLDPTSQALVFNGVHETNGPYHVRVTDVMGRVLADGPLGVGQRFALGPLHSTGMVVVSLFAEPGSFRTTVLPLLQP